MANTTYLNIEIPDVGADNNTWGTIANATFNAFDACLRPTGNGTSVGLNVGSGNTLTVGGTLTATGTVTLPAGATAGGAVIVSLSGTQTLTNKTLTSPTIATPTFSGNPAGTIASGSWSPDFTNVVNVDSFTERGAFYLRIGAYVFANVRVTIDPTSSQNTQFRVSLPVASNLASEHSLIGICALEEFSNSHSPGRVEGDATNDEALASIFPTSGAPFDVNLQFSYVIA